MFISVPVRFISVPYLVRLSLSKKGTCGLCGQIGVWTGWVADVASGTRAAITVVDWVGLVLICFVLPAVLSWIFCQVLRKWGWIKENDLKLDL